MSVVKEYLTTAADGRVLDASGNSIWQSTIAKLQLPDKQVIEIWQSKTAKLEEWATPPDRLFYRLNFSSLLYIVG